MTSILNQGLTALNIDLSDNAKRQLLDYVALIQKWRQVYNLIGHAETQDLFILHILDSLAIAPYITGKNILDVGTGAGLPGIPLAISFPDKKFTLMDASRKKTIFLQQVVHDLELSNVTVVHGRVENYQTKQCFDGIVSRAFASLEKMLSLTQHLCCAQGKFFAMKGTSPEEEIASLAEVYKIDSYKIKVPFLDAERHLVIIERK